MAIGHIGILRLETFALRRRGLTQILKLLIDATADDTFKFTMVQKIL